RTIGTAAQKPWICVAFQTPSLGTGRARLLRHTRPHACAETKGLLLASVHQRSKGPGGFKPIAVGRSPVNLVCPAMFGCSLYCRQLSHDPSPVCRPLRIRQGNETHLDERRPTPHARCDWAQGMPERSYQMSARQP